MNAVALHDRGWTMLPARVPADVVDRVRGELDRVCADHHGIQLRNGVDAAAEGTAHHLPCAGGVFLDVLEHLAAAAPFDDYFAGPYILNTYGGVLNLPGRASYVGRVHRDQRTFTGEF